MKNKVIGIILIVFLIMTTSVYAANDSYETTLKANNSQFKAEDTVIITIGLSNIKIESGEKGIGGYTANIKFDPSVLEYVSASGTDKWEAPFYSDGIITGYTKGGEVVNTTQSIGTITFKVKKGAKLGKTTIGLENFSGTSVGADILATNKAIDVTIVESGNNTGTGSDNEGSGNTGTNNSNNNGANKNPSTSGSQNSTKKENIKKGVLPKAGNGNVEMFTVIGGGVVLAIALFVRFKVIDRKMKNDK